MPKSSTTRRIPPREWENRKPRILKLYIDDERKLTEVIEEMTKEGFTATRSQYERQFKAWGVRKNMTRSEWTRVIQEQQHGIRNARVTLSGRAISDSRQETARRRYTPRKSQALEALVLHNNDAANPIATGAEYVPIEESLPQNAINTAFHSQANSPPMDMTADVFDFEMAEDITLLDVTGATIDLPYHQNYGELELPIDNTNLINSANLSLSRPEENFLSPVELSTISFSSNQFTDLGELSAHVEWPLFPITPPTTSQQRSLSAIDGHSQIRLRAQWTKPLPSSQIVATITKGNKNWADFSLNNPASSSQNIVWRFLADINGPKHTTTTIPPTIRNLFSTQALIGEGQSQFSIVSCDILPEVRLNTRLIALTINGFPGLEDIPAGGILKFLNRHTAIQLSMAEFMRSNKGPVARSLAENIFLAALQADDVDVIKFLLDHTNFVNANDTVCYYRGERLTPLGVASISQSLGIIKLFVSRKVDVNKAYPDTRNCSGLDKLVVCNTSSRETFNDDLLSTVDAFLEAGAVVSEFTVKHTLNRFTDPRLTMRLIRSSASRTPKLFLSEHGLLSEIVKYLSGDDKTNAIQFITKKCQESGYDVGPTLLIVERREAPMNAHRHPVPPESTPEEDEEMTLNESLIAAFESEDPSCLHTLDEIGVLNRLQDENKLGEAFTEALKAGCHEYITKILEIDPDLEFANDLQYKSSPDGHRHYLCGTLSAALSHGFDDIAWDLIAFMVATDWMDMIRDLLKTVLEAEKRDFVKAVMESCGVLDLDLRSAYGSSYDSEYSTDKLPTSFTGMIQAAINWGDESILNNFWKDCAHEPLLSRRVLEISLEKEHLDLFWGFLGSFDLSTTVIMIDEWILEKAVQEHPSIIKPLLERYRNAYPVGHSGYGWKAIQKAIKLYPESSEALDMFFDFGLMTPDIPQGKRGKTFLATAINYRHHRNKSTSSEDTCDMSLVKRLFDLGSDVNIAIGRDEYEYEFGYGNRYGKSTAFLDAIKHGDKALTEFLIQNRADTSKPACFGIRRTPLQCAAEQNNIDIVQLLLDNGADVNGAPATFFGATALQFAAMRGNCEMVKLLMEYGAQLNTPPVRGFKGRWPLEGAAENGRLDMIQLLWNLNGGPFDDRQCKKAMRLAEKNGYLGCRDWIKELMAKGSSITGLSSTW
ncbi:hypothetical protein F4805DRAFT_412562 [Annulohypoxylon moriforme]|nr:hypothetical protein F4805DRAFT_412562 [Annulohypoxylon moriforme]